MKKLNKWFALLLALCMTLSLAACGGSSAAASASASTAASSDAAAPTDTASGSGQVGILLPTVEAEYFVGVANTIEEGLEAQGFEFITTSYDWSADKEIQAVENFVVQGVDAIVVITFDAAADSAFKAAMDAGVKVVVAGCEPENYSYNVISENTLIGECVANMAIDWINANMDGKAQISILSSEGSPSGADRTAGMQKAFAEKLPDSEIVLVQDPGSKAGDGNEFAENLLLRYPDVNVVCSISDDRALEVFESFKAANHVGDDVAIFGCDCNGQALNYIKEGTSYRGSADTGDYGAEIVKILPQLIAGDTSIGNQTVCTGVGVTIDNVDDYLK